MATGIFKFVLYCVAAWLLANAIFVTIKYFNMDVEMGWWGLGVFSLGLYLSFSLYNDSGVEAVSAIILTLFFTLSFIIAANDIPIDRQHLKLKQVLLALSGQYQPDNPDYKINKYKEPLNIILSENTIIYAGPGNNFPALETEVQGESVKAIGKFKDKNWLKVVLKDQSHGFIAFITPKLKKISPKVESKKIPIYAKKLTAEMDSRSPYKYGYKDENDNWVIKPQYVMAGPFGNTDKAYVELKSETQGSCENQIEIYTWASINRKGEIIEGPKRDKRELATLCFNRK